MNYYSKEIFKMLNVKPFEEFEINNHLHTYRLTNELMLQFKKNEVLWINAEDGLTYILNGAYTIRKNFQPTEKEKLALDYAKACGYKWLAKEKDGTVVMFERKPIRTERHWAKDEYIDKANVLEIPLSFIKWEDEPYYIGN